MTDGELDVYQVNLALRADRAARRALGGAGIDFKGSATLGPGSVNADGHIEWRNLQPYGKFHLAGTNLRVVDLPEAQIDASPDLDFAIAARKIEVTGKVLVPYAKIAPKDITNAVRASDDEVIVGVEPDDPSKRFEVMSDITLALGDRITIDTMGLTARLSGSIEIRSGYDAITRAQRRSWHRRRASTWPTGGMLDIDSGRLISPAARSTTPASRSARQEGVPGRDGLRQRARHAAAAAHVVQLHPPLPQSQIVSLILAGGSLESAQTPRRRQRRPRARASRCSPSSTARVVGIQDVGLESDITNETSLVLGRYLYPRLYVSYGISLTEQLNTLKLRYTLGDHWTIKTEVGQAQGADLVYTISRSST